jgi:cell division septation protein DedD
MATTASERRSRVVEALGFWFITLVICAAAGLGSYRFGRQWIGDRLGGDVKSVLTSDELADRVSEKAFSGGEAGPETDVLDEPPAKAVVEVESAGVSSEDRQKLRYEKKRDADEAPVTEREADKDEPKGEAGTEKEKPQPVADAEPASNRAERPAVPEPSRAADRGGRENVVRAGSFSKSVNAERLVDELRSKGYQPFVTETVVDGVTYHRVNVARYDDRDKALELRGELRADGYPAEVSSE